MRSPNPIVFSRFTMKRHRGLLALLLIFIGLSLVYNTSLPLFEAPDEMDHFRYADWFSTEKKLPHIISDLPAVGHELFQPPLYYLMMAPVAAAINTTDLWEIAPVNWDLPAGAGSNGHYHTRAEAFPYRGTALAVHVMRLLSSLLACVTIVSTYGIARLVVPGQALLAAAIVALNPMFIFLSAAVNNDTLVIALSTLTLWWLIRLLFKPNSPAWHFVGLGVLWGLVTLSKVSGLTLGGVVFLGLVLAAWQVRSWRWLLKNGLLTGLGGLVTAGWWLGRSWLLYGDPLAWEATLFANRGLLRETPLAMRELYQFAGGLLNSYWGSFGYGGVRAPTIFYTLVNLLVLLALIGVGVWLARNVIKKPLPTAVLAVILLLVWNGLLFVSLLRWMSLLLATDQGRLLFPGLGALAVLIALGSATLSPGKRNWPGIGLAAILGIGAVLAPFLLIQPAYAQPKAIPDLNAIPHAAQVRFGEHISLLGYELSQTAVSPGESVQVDLYWDTDAPLPENYLIALHTLDASGEVVSRLDTLPTNGRYATPAWEPNHPFKDSHILPPVSETAVPGQGRVIVTLYPWGRPAEALPVTVSDTPIGTIHTLSPLKIAPAAPRFYAPTTKIEAAFGDKFKLLGFDAPDTLAANQPYPITLYWEALQPDGRDYTVFVHLLNSEGQLAAQADSPPQNNRFPTSIWAAGEQIADVHHLQLPEDLPAGEYTILVGMYDSHTGQRLTAVTANGSLSPENSIRLITTTVSQP
jgi:hypothetical protein